MIRYVLFGLQALVLIAPPLCLYYGWVQYTEKLRKESFPTKNRFTVIALSLISLATGAFPAVVIFAVGSNSAGVHYADVSRKLAIFGCGLAFVIGLVGRPRAIVPIALSSLGTVALYLMLTPD